MSTDKQTAANRRNAQHSTGPITPAGKARSSQNALLSGIYADSLLLPEENIDDLRALIAEYYLFHTPFSPAARAAVDNLIRAEWLTRRLARIDTQILSHEVHTLAQPDPGCTSGQAFESCRVSMQKVQQRITAIDNMFHRNLRAFQLLQPEIDLEPAPPVEAADPQPAAAPDAPLSTGQPAEATSQTPEMASFRKTTPIDAKGHPVDFSDCPNCQTLGSHSPSCHYDLRRAS